MLKIIIKKEVWIWWLVFSLSLFILVLPVALAEESDEAALSNLEELSKSTAPEVSNDLTPLSAPIPDAPAAAPVFSKPEKLVEQAPVEKVISRRAERRSAYENEITNLEFKLEGDTAQVLVSSREKLTLTETKNEAKKQLVYYFENTVVPNRFQRAYDTTEFLSPVSLFTLVQIKNAPPKAKLIVQLREWVKADLQNTEKGMVLSFPVGAVVASRNPQSEDNADLINDENGFLNNQSYSGKKIEVLSIKNSDVQDVLRLIAKYSGYNIVIGEDVTGKVGTLNLENIPWDQAFALVLQSKKLGYVRHGNVLRVATLSSLKTEKDDLLASEHSRLKVETLKTSLIPISYAKAADLAPRAKNFLSERGTIDTDDRTNTIVVRDVEKSVNRIQKLFSVLDTQPPRVMISAKVIEMTEEVTRNFGFNALSLNTHFSGVNIESRFTPGASLSGASQITIAADKLSSLNANFQLLEVDKKLKLLASPSVSVIQNEKGIIKQNLSFIRLVQGSVVSGVQQAPSFQSVNAELILEATPVVASDGTISMALHVKNDVPNIGVSGNGSVDSRDITTHLLLKNGDTAAIGGIFRNLVSREHSGVPLFMDIPILGFFFSSRSMEDSRSEIMIFLTAKITNAEDSFKKNL